MSVSKLTIIAQMRDELTGPLKAAQKNMDALAASSRKSAAAADMQSESFRKLAKEQGYATNEAGRWVDAQNRFVSKSRVSAAAAEQQATALTRASGATGQQAKAFEQLAFAAGWTISAQGRVHDAQGRYVNDTNLSIARTMANSKAQHRLAMAQDNTGASFLRAARHNKVLREEFDLQLKSFGYSVDAQGKIVNSLGKYASASELADAKAFALAETNRKVALEFKDLGKAQANVVSTNEDLGAVMEEFGGRSGKAKRNVEKLTRSMNAMEQANQTTGQGFNTRTVRMGAQVKNLAQAFGVSDTAASRFSTTIARSIDSGAISRGVDAYTRNIDRMRDHTDRAASGIQNAMKRTGQAVGVATAALGAYALATGLQRHAAFQSADVRLDVLDYSEDEREQIKDTTNELVVGTPIPLDAAMTGGQKILAAGIPYEDYARRMETMVNATSLYSVFDPEQLPHVMGQITSKRFLQGEEMLQLAELGVNPTKVLAEHLNVPTEEIMPMVEGKEITADIWWDALEPFVEGGAKKMGETFIGAWATMKASIARVGQNFETPLLEPLEDVMRLVTELLDSNEKIWLDFGQAGVKGVNVLLEVLPELNAMFVELAPSMSMLFGALSVVLPRLIQGFVTWFTVITPIIDPLVRIIALTLEITAFLLPALIPLLLGAGTAWGTWKVLKGISALLMIFWPTLNLATASVVAANFAIGVFSKSLLMFPGTWIVIAIMAVVGALGYLYDESEFVRDEFDKISAAIRSAGDWLDNFGEKIDNFVKDKFPRLHALNEALAVPLNFINNLSEDIGSALGNDSGLHRQMGTGAWDRTGQGAFRFTHGAESRDDQGQPIGQEAALQLRMEEGNPFEGVPTGADWINRDTPPNRLRDLPSKLPEGGLPPISIIEMPSAEQQLEDRLNEGRADGGWTGPGTINVGERGREFITSAWSANQVESNHPGALAYINDTGTLPPSGGVNVQANVDIHGVNDPEEIRQVVMEAIADAAREASRGYMTPAVTGAG